MTSFHFTEYILPTLQAGACLIVGTLVGAFQFLTLRWSVAMLAAGRAPVLLIATQLGRFALSAGILGVIAGRFGVSPLLLAGAGIIMARMAIIPSELPA